MCLHDLLAGRLLQQTNSLAEFEHVLFGVEYIVHITDAPVPLCGTWLRIWVRHVEGY